MANIREIKNRVVSTKNTAKVTRAMQMVSAAKSKSASKEAISVALYCKKINEIVNKLGIGVKRVSTTNNKIGVVVVGPSRGFVGQLNNMIMGALMQFKKDKAKYIIEGIGIQKHGAKIITQCGIEVKYNFENGDDISAIYTLLHDKFDSSEYGELFIVYSRFINLLKSEAIVERLLPAESMIIQAGKIDDSYLYEPDQEEVMKNLEEKLFEAKILSAILNNKASEHASRMMTMQNATENAMDLVGTLTQKLNKERQNKITQQIIEVASGGKNYEN
ncbi:MAG: ATP synthase F1 subunit gamma [Candidatus Shapirobacteria bacterium]